MRRRETHPIATVLDERDIEFEVASAMSRPRPRSKDRHRSTGSVKEGAFRLVPVIHRSGNATYVDLTVFQFRTT